jgi:hypothetical protein
MAACRQLRQVPLLLEGGFHWYDAAANDCQGVEFGASGSPILSLATGMVVGVLNTKAETGSPYDPCGLNQPCEAGPMYVDFYLGTNYAIPTTGLDACFDATGRFQVALDGCPLDRGVQMKALVPRLQLPAVPGASLPVDVPLSAEGLSHYRTAVVRAATDDCRDESAYGPVVALADAPAVAATVPGDPGISLLCLQAGRGPDPTAGGWQDARTPTVVAIEVVR